MVWRVLGIIGIISLVIVFSVTPVRAAGGESLTVSDISDQLVCQCGCNSILTNCSHLECASQTQMTAFIVQEMERGQTGPEIIQTFVRQYGEQVLAAPPKRGFNLVAWVLPFAAIAAGAGVVYLALKTWVQRGNVEQEDDEDEVDTEDEKYRLRLERELKEFAEESFR